MKIAVIGSGSFGTAMAALFEKKGYVVSLWSFSNEEAQLLESTRKNVLLPDVILGKNISCTNSLQEATKDAKLIVTVVPSFATRTTAKALSPFIKDNQPIVNLSKGLENNSLLRLSQVYKEEIPNARFAVLSGPSHAEEIGKNLPTTAVVASEDKNTAKFVQDTIMDDNFRIYLSEDEIGVEIGGALKNVIALCAGISDGLGYGDNTKAALMTRGMAEITRIGVAMGAKSDTFFGLSGIGDLIVTCTSMHSRNRRCGILLGRGMGIDEAQKEIGMVVESIHTVEAAHLLGKKYGVSVPIIDEAYNIVFKNKNPRLAARDLMKREKKTE